jgi:hypothetical protein
MVSISNLTMLLASAVMAYRPEALGPLSQVQDFGRFAAEMARLKAAGVEAFALDVWWRWVEPQDNVFTWDYYDRLAKIIIDAGLKWIPILSTHQCGFRGDPNCFIPIPEWTGIANNEQFQFKDVFGVTNIESLSPWSGDYAYQQYDELYAAFAKHYAPIKEHIVRIDLSGGTSGELRYPSYAQNWAYPQRGQLQAYTSAAVKSFRDYVVRKYGSLQGVATAWGTRLASVEDIRPPCDITTQQSNFGVCAGRTGIDGFFSFGVQSQFGRDFGEWYQADLLKHSERLAAVAHKNFDPVFNCTIAMKVAGIHWQYFNPGEARSAERAAGYWDYATLLRAFKQQRLEVTFTAIEMNDNRNFPEWSGAKTLTREFYTLCRDIGAECGSENALPVVSSQGSPYPNMRELLSNFPVKSLTFLRFNDLVSSLDNTQAYANYVTAVRGNKNSLHFQIKGVATQLGQTLSVVGNVPQLGDGNPNRALRLAPFNCNGDRCIWVGTAVIDTPNKRLEFQVMLNGQNRLIQCTPFNFSPTTRATTLLVNLGNGDFTNNGIRTINFGGDLNITCRVNEPPTSTTTSTPTPTTSPTTTSPPTPSPTTPPGDVRVGFRVTHDAGFGDSVYVVGGFNNWNSCAAVPCNWSAGNVWNCGPIDLKAGTRYEWKPIKYGTRSKTTCSAPVWKTGANEVFTASQGVQPSVAY